MNDQPTTPPKRENIWLNIGLNVLLPSLLLVYGQSWLDKMAAGIAPLKSFLDRIQETMDWETTSPVVLIVALAFPISYGIYDFVVRRKYNFFSILGFVSILISGGIALMELDKGWIAIKEAAIPALFAVAVVVSLKTPFPLIRTFLFNPEIFNVPKIEAALVEKDKKQPFEKLMSRCTLMLAGSFLMSAVLNYFLAKYFIQSESDTDAFKVEMGKMQFWSWPVITVPSMIIMFYILNQLLNGIHKYTGYDFDDVLLVGQPAKKQEEGDQSNNAEEQSASNAGPVEVADEVPDDIADEKTDT